MQIDNLLDELKSLSDNNTITFNDISLNKSGKIDVKDIVLAVAFDHVNHGIWSSLFAHHVLRNHLDKEIKDNIPDSNKIFLGYKDSNIIIRDICKAILPHHIADWEVDNILKDFDVVEKNIGKWSDIAKIDAQYNPLGYLLSFCDIFCQAGREDPENTEDKGKASDMQIKFLDMDINTSMNIISITISYKEGKETSELEKTKKDFFEKPLKCLGIKSYAEGKLKIKLISTAETGGDYIKNG